ncbi:MAG: lysophospholipid acyltransferase family protein [Treponemataceae bacterium]|nr:MAG: lysophospholipid acyltransferase family protein [Treponemataceae bacterium]
MSNSKTLPPIKNYPLYFYRIFAKCLSFFLFGFGSVLLTLIFLPALSPILVRSPERFKKHGLALISFTWRFFVWFMRIINAAHLHVSAEDKARFKNMHGKIIVANHPSLLDVVMLVSLIPNADCIVNAALAHNIFVRRIVRMLYIINTLDFMELSERCITSLHAGNCLIIFPEGSRTPRSGHVPLKRGAARLALSSGCPLLIVRMAGNDKYGLGKHDPWVSYNHRETYCYEPVIIKEIAPTQYEGLPVPIAVRKMTADIESALFPS